MIRKVCENCGGENVIRDAWAEWDENNQSWELGNIFDNAYCEDCDGETTIEDIEIEPATALSQ